MELGFLYRTFLARLAQGGEAAEFQQIAARDSNIVFLAKQFAGSPMITLRHKLDNVGVAEIAVYAALGYHAQIFLAQGMKGAEVSLERRQSPKEALSEWDVLKNKEVVWGKTGSSSSPIGEVDWQGFNFGPLSCFVFYRAFAPTSTSYGPTKYMHGFFCNKPGEKLTAESIQDLFHRLGVHDYAEPKPR
jgi:hypothetical protein